MKMDREQGQISLFLNEPRYSASTIVLNANETKILFLNFRLLKMPIVANCRGKWTFSYPVDKIVNWDKFFEKYLVIVNEKLWT